MQNRKFLLRSIYWFLFFWYRSDKAGNVVSNGITSGVPIAAKGFAVDDAKSSFRLFEFERRIPRDDDVLIRIHYCGICHSDIHQAKNEWQNSIYPMVPGHEIAGVVEQVGSKVKHFRVGDHVGVGCLVDSCLHCDSCKSFRPIHH